MRSPAERFRNWTLNSRDHAAQAVCGRYRVSGRPRSNRGDRVSLARKATGGAGGTSCSTMTDSLRPPNECQPLALPSAARAAIDAPARLPPAVRSAAAISSARISAAICVCAASITARRAAAVVATATPICTAAAAAFRRRYCAQHLHHHRWKPPPPPPPESRHHHRRDRLHRAARKAGWGARHSATAATATNRILESMDILILGSRGHPKVLVIL